MPIGAQTLFLTSLGGKVLPVGGDTAHCSGKGRGLRNVNLCQGGTEAI